MQSLNRPGVPQEQGSAHPQEPNGGPGHRGQVWSEEHRCSPGDWARYRELDDEASRKGQESDCSGAGPAHGESSFLSQEGVVVPCEVYTHLGLLIKPGFGHSVVQACTRADQHVLCTKQIWARLFCVHSIEALVTR